MCEHPIPCPGADSPYREAAKPTASHYEQGWSVSCTFLKSLGNAMSGCPRSSA
ncbi:DUF5999 family protein [Streptomyces sp. NPDC058579]|uniref:DUF5999 family protein n=1 Tax=Streptomyces sp. NPDC058579 TaxID=3346548 RepID=UPI00365F78EF